MKTLYVLTIALFLNNCFGGTIDPNVPDEKYLEYGNEFTFVVKVTGSNNYYASAVLINKDTFLTNAHVSDKIDKIIVEDSEFKIIKIMPHKNYEKHSHKNDIAIGKIKEDFKLKFYPKLYQKNDEIGKVVSISGFGSTGTFSTGKIRSDKKRRAGSNIVSEVTDYFCFCSALGGKKTELEFLICHGDSGGGMFIGNELAGLNCFIDTKDGTYNSNYNDKSGYVRIYKYIDWIEENLKQD